MRLIALGLASTALLAAAAGPASAAAPCRDAQKRFVKCPPKPPAPARCKTVNGKFAKCGTPGAKPA